LDFYKRIHHSFEHLYCADHYFYLQLQQYFPRQQPTARTQNVRASANFNEARQSKTVPSSPVVQRRSRTPGAESRILTKQPAVDEENIVVTVNRSSGQHNINVQRNGESAYKSPRIRDSAPGVRDRRCTTGLEGTVLLCLASLKLALALTFCVRAVDSLFVTDSFKPSSKFSERLRECSLSLGPGVVDRRTGSILLSVLLGPGVIDLRCIN
jgi:hypothetical protein